jgi:hypothetical protein
MFSAFQRTIISKDSIVHSNLTYLLERDFFLVIELVIAKYDDDTKSVVELEGELPLVYAS